MRDLEIINCVIYTYEVSSISGSIYFKSEQMQIIEIS